MRSRAEGGAQLARCSGGTGDEGCQPADRLAVRRQQVGTGDQGAVRSHHDRVGRSSRAGPVLLPAASPAGKATPRLACFKRTTPAPVEKPAFRKRPSNCIYIDKRGLANLIPPATTVRKTRGVRWTKWGGRKALGRGKGFVADRNQPVTVWITLSRPVRRCGKRVYSRAKLRYEYTGNTIGPYCLVTC
jgi:hypothetical protein